MMPQERRVVDRFDADKDDRLDAAERKAAREWLAQQPPQGLAGFGRRGGPPRGFQPPPGFAPPPGFGGRGMATPSPGRRVSPSEVKPAGRAPLYDVRTLRTLFLQFESSDWEQELEDFHDTDVEVPATLTVDGASYRNVGVHFRGMSSFMVPDGLKRSLNLAMDFVDEDQRLLGHRTLNLLNGNGDPTLVRALLYSEIASHYIPTAKTNYVRVVINGEDWGVYVNAEQFNTDFVRDRFGTTRGARWKVPGSPFGQGGMRYLGEDAAAYKAIYDIRSRDDAKSWAGLIGMFRILAETPLDELEAALAPVLDVDGALKFLALEMALVNSDGYWARASDYNIYQDERGRFHVLPHDFNEALADEGGGGRGGRGGRRGGGPPPGFQPPPGFTPPPGFPPVPPGGFPATFGQAGADLDPLVGLDDVNKPLRSRLLAVPALREKYLGYVREIADKWLDWRTLEPLVTQYQSVIAEAVKTDTRKLYTTDAFIEEVAASETSLKRFVEARRAFLLSNRRP
jgi:hypothetical protein